MEAIIMIAISLVLFYAAFAFRQKAKNLSGKGIEAEGVVFDIVEGDTTRSLGRYPVIRFLTSQKEWITQEYNIGISPNLFKKGQKVSVLYNPDDPKEFIIKSASTTVVPIVAIILALILLGIGLYKLHI